jgi:hypothetical protein
MLKKLAIAFGALFVLVIGALIVIPLVVDVDKYRPQLVSAVNDKINGKLELGKLSLSLWGQIKIEIAGLSVQDAKGNKVLSVSDAYFQLPFSSVLGGSPDLVFKMAKPAVTVTKNKAGKMNLLSLMKPSAPAPTGQAAAAPAQPAAGASAPVALPALVTRARLGVEMTGANVIFHDDGTGLDSKIEDFNFVLRDISLSQPTQIEIWADVDTKMGKVFFVKGPFKITGQAKPELTGSTLDHVTLTAKVDLDGLDLAAPPMFEKKAGMAANADVAISASPKELRIDKFNIKFFNADITSSGTVTNFAPGPNGAEPDPTVSYTIASNAIDLKPWNQLVPMLSEYELAGSMKLDAQASGPAEKLGYKAKLAVVGLTAKAPKLKEQPRFDLVADVVTDQLENFTMTMKAPGNDLSVKGKVVSFSKPRITFDVTSNELDLDKLVEMPPKGAKAAPAAPAAEGAGGATAGKAAPKADLDAELEPLRENKALAAMDAQVGFHLKSIQAQGMKIADLGGKLYFRDLAAGLDGFSMKIFGGTIKSGFSAQLKPKTPTYKFSTTVTDLDLKEAMTSQLESMKNTIMGKANFEMTGEGSSFNTDPAIGNLKAKGSMKIVNATFGTLDIGKMASDAINQGIGKAASKVPQLAGKTVSPPSGRQQIYESVSSDFTIEGGKFHAPNFIAKARKDDGIDFKGDTTVGMKDFSLAASWQVIDTYNVTKARDISAGNDVPHILAEGSNPVQFPAHAGCTILAPCYTYTEVPEYFLKVAFNNATSAATGKAKAAVQQQAQALIQKVAPAAPPAVQSQIQNLGKKLFGN